MKIYKTAITRRKEVALNTLEVTFKRPENFHFKAGQYLQIELLAMPYKGPGSNSRVFSIASSPGDTEIQIAFRRSGSGFKRSIASMPLGSEVNIQGPYGYLTLEKELGYPLVCVAGGIGITPCLSMIRFAREAKLNTPITLLYANHNRQSTAYMSELGAISDQNKWLKLNYVFGLIQRDSVHKITKRTHNNRWLVTGPPAMVEHVRNLLSLEGVDEHRVYYEEFKGY